MFVTIISTQIILGLLGGQRIDSIASSYAAVLFWLWFCNSRPTSSLLPLDDLVRTPFVVVKIEGPAGNAKGCKKINQLVKMRFVRYNTTITNTNNYLQKY